MELNREAYIEADYEDSPTFLIGRDKRNKRGRVMARMYHSNHLTDASLARLQRILDDPMWVQRHDAGWDHRNRTLHCRLLWKYRPDIVTVETIGGETEEVDVNRGTKPCVGSAEIAEVLEPFASMWWRDIKFRDVWWLMGEEIINSNVTNGIPLRFGDYRRAYLKWRELVGDERDPQPSRA